jgi:hypothetical protein
MKEGCYKKYRLLSSSCAVSVDVSEADGVSRTQGKNKSMCWKTPFRILSIDELQCSKKNLILDKDTYFYITKV